MRNLLLPLTLVLPLAAGAQDRASLDRFTAAYDKAEMTMDSGWFLAHMDEKGTVGSGKSAMTRAQMAKEMKAAKTKPAPMYSKCKTTIDKATIAGKTATVDYTTVATMRSTKKPVAFKGHATAVWKAGDWRILHVETKPAK